MAFNDLQPRERAALLRALAGRELGQRAARSLRQGLARSRRLEAARQRQKDDDNKMGAAARPRPGGVSPSPPRPAPRSPELSGRVPGGAALRPEFNARVASHGDLQRRLAQLGIPGHNFVDNGINRQLREQAVPPDRGVRLAEQARRALARGRQAARAREIEGSAIDGRDATPDQVRGRLDELLGRRTAGRFAADFREHGQALPRAAEPPTPTELEDDAERRLVARIGEARAAGRRVDARELSDSEFRLLLAARGLPVPGGWGTPMPGSPRR